MGWANNKAGYRAFRERLKADPARLANDKKVRKEVHARYRAKRKLDAINAYGGKCKCCGEEVIQFLTIDHIHGGGTQHRLSLEINGSKVGGGRFYQLLRQQGYPPGYEVLCWNCNCGRQLNGGVCPHKEKKWRSTKKTLYY